MCGRAMVVRDRGARKGRSRVGWSVGKIVMYGEVLGVCEMTWFYGLCLFTFSCFYLSISLTVSLVCL